MPEVNSGLGRAPFPLLSAIPLLSAKSGLSEDTPAITTAGPAVGAEEERL
jgi:hypothetical protein